MMGLKIKFSDEKNLILKATRRIAFEDVIEAIEKKRILDDLEHHKKDKYKRQRILVVKINNYVYAVPYVTHKEKGVIFLKTVYPSRVLTKKYLKERRRKLNEQKNK